MVTGDGDAGGDAEGDCGVCLDPASHLSEPERTRSHSSQRSSSLEEKLQTIH